MTLNPGDFKQGRRYRLTKTVQNSLLDLRYKGRSMTSPWEQGNVYCCSIGTNGIRFNLGRRWCDPVTLTHPNYAHFCAALEELPESADDALSSYIGSSPNEVAVAVVADLVKHGRISLADVRESVFRVATEDVIDKDAIDD